MLLKFNHILRKMISIFPVLGLQLVAGPFLHYHLLIKLAVLICTAQAMPDENGASFSRPSRSWQSINHTCISALVFCC